MAETNVALTKPCTKCGLSKTASEFYLDKRRSYFNGLFSQCKTCHNEGQKTRRAANPDKFSKWERDSYSRRAAERPIEIREKGIAKRLKRKFGLTRAEFDNLFASQGRLCAICAIPLVIGVAGKGNRSVACVDHDHRTGKIRGILCNSCNTGIGLLGDSKVRLAAALKYLSEE